MKIIHLIENLDDTYGGPAKSVPYLCKYLNDLGIETEILSIKYHENERNSIVEKYGLSWKSFKYDFIKKLRYSKNLKQYLENEVKKRDDIILHTHNLWNYIPYVASQISSKYNIPLVVAIRGSLYPWSLSQGKLQKQIAWRLFQEKMLQKSMIIHTTEKNELLAVKELGINTHTEIIPNGVEFSEFDNMRDKQTSKKILNLKQNKKYIFFISRLHPKKGLEFLINAWVKLATIYKDWDLLIVGPEYDKEYIENIKDVIKKENLEDRVVFTDMLEGEKRVAAFGASDLFVLPSHTENFGIAIAEAMVAQLPVVTTKGTPWQEIEENDAGWWVELTQENINKVLEEALSCSDEELKQKGLNGFELIQNYKWEYQAKRMKEVYENINHNSSLE